MNSFIYTIWFGKKKRKTKERRSGLALHTRVLATNVLLVMLPPPKIISWMLTFFPRTQEKKNRGNQAIFFFLCEIPTLSSDSIVSWFRRRDHTVYSCTPYFSVSLLSFFLFTNSIGVPCTLAYIHQRIHINIYRCIWRVH